MTEPSRPQAQTGIRLATCTTLGVGGAAARFYKVRSIAELISIWRHEIELGAPRPIVLGDGSNVVVSDAGIDGAVLSLELRGITIQTDPAGATLTVAAGESWDEVVARSVELGLAGMECMSGIPGRCGAAPIQNIGAYGQELKDIVEKVRVLDTSSLAVTEFPTRECAFDYRTSRFKAADRDRFVVVDLSLRLSGSPPAPVSYEQLLRAAAEQGADLSDLKTRRKMVLGLRRSKSMVLDSQDPWSRSVGSFFMNPILSAQNYAKLAGELEGCPTWPTSEGVKLAAAWLIERSGIRRGQRVGGAAISKAHALAIVNVDQASAADVIALARQVRRAVRDTTGVTLEPEPRFLGFSDDPFLGA